MINVQNIIFANFVINLGLMKQLAYFGLEYELNMH